MKRILVTWAIFALTLTLLFLCVMLLPTVILMALGILLVAPKAADLAVFLSDLILGCEEPSDRSDLPPMTANIPSEAAKALGLTAPGDEAYIEVTEVNSDGSVVVMAEMEDAEDSAPPPPAPAPAAMPEELGKMLGS